tara:strand:- start:14 stop:457 length:444 start_codon:yes stop_codon:yes gene_type:complete
VTEKVTSRIGLDADAYKFDRDENLLELLSAKHSESQISCVMVDEAQFLTKDQVWQLGRISDELDIPVLSYGLRSDFRGEPFEGSEYLLTWADNLKEIKAICHCGRKATMVLRVDESGEVVSDGAQVVIGDAQYRSVCRKHFAERVYE